MSIKEKLQKQLDSLVQQLKDERVAWNEYLQGEGIIAGHEHSLHQGQDAKFGILEQRISDLEELLASDIELIAFQVKARLDGEEKIFIIADYEVDILGRTRISHSSPVGTILLEMDIDEERKLNTPKGEITVIKLSHDVLSE